MRKRFWSKVPDPGSGAALPERGSAVPEWEVMRLRSKVLERVRKVPERFRSKGSGAVPEPKPGFGEVPGQGSGQVLSKVPDDSGEVLEWF